MATISGVAHSGNGCLKIFVAKHRPTPYNLNILFRRVTLFKQEKGLPLYKHNIEFSGRALVKVDEVTESARQEFNNQLDAVSRWSGWIRAGLCGKQQPGNSLVVLVLVFICVGWLGPAYQHQFVLCFFTVS